MRLKLGILTALIVAVLIGIAFYIRVEPTYNQVFVGDQIRFLDPDSYYHMRLVDNLLNHFPDRINFDPYTNFPEGTAVFWPPFTDWLIAGIAYVLGGGAPTQHLADTVGAWMPAVMGALMVIPVYLLGHALFNRWVGLVAAALIAVNPGGYLNRSSLGFTDHHISESLFVTLTMLFLVLALQASRRKGITFLHVRNSDWTTLAMPLLYSGLAGLSLGIYLLNWTGGLLAISLLFGYFILQSIIDHLRGENPEYLGIIAPIVFLIGGDISLFLAPPNFSSESMHRVYMLSLMVAVVAPPLLVYYSRRLTAHQAKPSQYPIRVLAIGMILVGVLYIMNRSIFMAMLGGFETFASTSGVGRQTIYEAQPLLLPFGNFSFSDAWGQFTTGFLFAPIALAILAFQVVKRGEPNKMLILLWSIVMLIAVLIQRRYSYYFAVNASLLTGYLSWEAARLVIFNKPAKPTPPKTSKKHRKTVRIAQPVISTPVLNHTLLAVALVLVLLVAVYPNVGLATAATPSANFSPGDAWQETLSWLKTNTPEPFAPDYYYALYDTPPPGQHYTYPDSAYGVLAWWDYGHWITRIAQRIPVSNPFQQGASEVASFLSAQDEASANRMVAAMGNVKYVIVDSDIATQFYATATFAGLSESRFYDTYVDSYSGMTTRNQLFYPEYYRSMASRLFNFNGKQAIPGHSRVVTYKERTGANGQTYKEVVNSQVFNTYDEASAYLVKQANPNIRIVGDDTQLTNTPLEALQHYKLVHTSRSAADTEPGKRAPTIKVFEYTK